MKRIISIVLSLFLLISIGIKNINAAGDVFDITVSSRNVSWDASAIEAILGDTPDKYEVVFVLNAVKNDTEKELLNTRIEAVDTLDFSSEIQNFRAKIEAEDDNDDEFQLLISVEAIKAGAKIGVSNFTDECLRHFYRLDSIVKTLDKDGNEEADPNKGGTVSSKYYYYEDEQAEFVVFPNAGYTYEAEGNEFDTTSILEKEKVYLNASELVKVTFVPTVKVKIDTGANHKNIADHFMEYFDDLPSTDELNPIQNDSIIEINIPLLLDDGDGFAPARYEEYRDAFYYIAYEGIDNKDAYTDKSEYLADVNNDPNRGSQYGQDYEDLKEQVKDGDVFYILWSKAINKVEITIDKIACGTKVEVVRDDVGDIVSQKPTPKVTIKTDNVSIAKDLDDEDFIYWVILNEKGESEDAFEGVVNDTMNALALFKAAGGYYFPANVEVLVNGEKAFHVESYASSFALIHKIGGACPINPRPAVPNTSVK